MSQYVAVRRRISHLPVITGEVVPKIESDTLYRPGPGCYCTDSHILCDSTRNLSTLPPLHKTHSLFVAADCVSMAIKPYPIYVFCTMSHPLQEDRKFLTTGFVIIYIAMSTRQPPPTSLDTVNRCEGRRHGNG